MGTEGKYGKITTERGSIPDDEPVFLFRAQDRLLPAVLSYYRDLCVAEGSPDEHADGIQLAQAQVAAWQAMHADRVHLPDSASGLLGHVQEEKQA